ncbi:hypothetical protein BJV82DRAFT_223432 [Fennellomyces sp. T-0311]|nr:hypothetical protein BJV82DRAFT_223432 [Fennellomyces sp. T-0311]
MISARSTINVNQIAAVSAYSGCSTCVTLTIGYWLTKPEKSIHSRILTIMCSTWQWMSLPSEIQYKIFGHLTFRERCRCSMVCRSWHSLIMTWVDMWKSLSTTDGHTIVPELLQYKKYIDGSSVKHICVRKSYDNAYGVDLQQIIKFLMDQGCNMIEQVEIQFQEADKFGSRNEFGGTNNSVKEALQIAAPTFYDLTRISGDTLTRITFDIDTDKINATPDLLLKHCPELEQLSYTTLSLDQMSWISELNGVNHQHLVDFHVQISRMTIYSDLKPILEAMPKLQRLGVLTDYNIGDNGAQIASIIRQCCPDLVNLCLATFQDRSILKKWCATDWKIRKSGQSGLEVLALYHEDDAAPSEFWIILSQLLSESYKSLKTLELTSSLMPESPGLQDVHLNSISTLVFPSLTHLVLEHVYAYPHPWLFGFLEHSVPNLNSIALRYIWYGSDILHSLALGVKHLEHLELAHWPEYSEDELVQFFATMAQINPTLRSLTLMDMESATARVLEAVVSKYRAIDQMQVYEYPDMDIEGVGQFFANANLERKIEYLDLNLACIPPEESFFSPEIFTRQGSIRSALEKLNSNTKRWKLTLQPKYRRIRVGKAQIYPWSITDKEFRKQKTIGM